jgi:hypothetical protein
MSKETALARRKQRRPFRRFQPQQRAEDASQKQHRLESAARGLLSNRTPEQLQSELSDRELLLEEADRAAQLDPSPENLSRYRVANFDHQVVQLAVRISGNGRSGEPS